MSNLLKDDSEIKVSKSSFAIFENETSKYEGRFEKMNIKEVVMRLEYNNNIADALGYEIINTIYTLKFSTSRQITSYISKTKNINVDQSKIIKRLKKLVSLSIISSYSFVSDLAPEGTNVKIYALDNNGKILLKSKKFDCSWQLTDNLDKSHIKNFLIRNQYLINLLEYIPREKIKIRKILINGIGLTYQIDNSIGHIVIPIRRTENYKNELIENFKEMSMDSDVLMMSKKKIIIIGEDVKHIFEIYKELFEKKFINDTIYFLSDLKLFDSELKKSFVQFKFQDSNDNINENKKKVVLVEQSIDDFN